MKTTSEEWNKIVFEKRNKAYGAYQLRSGYNLRLIRAEITVITLSSLIILFLIGKNPVDPETKIIAAAKKEKVVFETFDIITIQPQKRTQVQSITVKDPASFKPVEEIKPIETVTRPVETISTVQTAGVNEGNEIRTTLAVGPSDPSEMTTDARSLAAVDIAPQFPGGIEKFYAYMNRMVRYSDQARRNGITGKLFVSFIVAADGSVESIKILQGLDESLDRQVIDALEQCPPWSPGKIGGTEVSTIMQLPVAFSFSIN